MSIDLEKFGQEAYTEYASAGGWVTPEGRSMQSWVSLHANEKSRWMNVAIAIADKIVKSVPVNTSTNAVLDRHAILEQLATSIAKTIA